MSGPLSVPDLLGMLRDFAARISALERRIPYTPQVVTAVPLGAVRDFGYSSLDTTTYSNVFRADVPLTAPILNYDVQVSTFWGAGITSVEFRIRARNPAGTYFDIASGSGAGGDQFADFVDLIPILGSGAIGQLIRFDIDVKRTGGSGDAAVRQIKPMVLRSPGPNTIVV